MNRRAPRYLRGLLLLTTAATLLLATIILRALYVEYRGLTPPRRSVPALSGPERDSWKDVEFSAEDGLALRGWFGAGTNDCGVVLVHGYSGNRADLMQEGLLLWQAGFSVLLFDLRAHGESGGEKTTYGTLERLDVAAAVDEISRLAHLRPGNVGMLAYSAGTLPAGTIAAQHPEVGALALLGTSISIRKTAEAEGGRLAWLTVPPVMLALEQIEIAIDDLDLARTLPAFAPRPLLVIHGATDEFVSLGEVREMFAYANEPKELLILRGTQHGNYFHSAAYRQGLLAFFDANLGKSHP